MTPPACQQVGKALTSMYGADSAAVARAIWLLADINSAKGLSREALLQYSHATSVISTHLGPSHPWLVELMVRAGTNMYNNGYNKQTMDTVEHCLAVLDKMIPGLDDKNAYLASILSLKGQVLVDMGDLPTSEKVLEKAMYAARESIGVKSEQHAVILMLLAETLMRQGKGEKVEAVLKQAMTTARGAVGGRDLQRAKLNSGAGGVTSLEIDAHEDSHPLLARIMTTYSAFVNLSGRPGKANNEAKRILEEGVMPLVVDTYGENHPMTHYVKGRIGRAKNIARAGSGKDEVRDALFKLVCHGDPLTEGGAGQYMFPCDARYVVDLGEYDDFYHKHMSKTSSLTLAITVHPLCLWALTKAQQIALATSHDATATATAIGAGVDKDEDSISYLSGAGPDGGSIGIGSIGSVDADSLGTAPPEEALKLSEEDVQDISQWGAVIGKGSARAAGGGRRSPAASVAGSGRSSPSKGPSGPSGGKLAIMIFNGEAPVSSILTGLYGAEDEEEARKLRKRLRAEQEAAAAAELAVEQEQLMAAQYAQQEAEMEDLGMGLAPVMQDTSQEQLEVMESLTAPHKEKEGGVQGVPLSAEETAEMEGLRAEIAALRQSKLEEQEAISAVRAQREAEEEQFHHIKKEVSMMEEARSVHKQELDRVQDELMKRQRENSVEHQAAMAAVSNIVEEGVGRVSRPGSGETAGFPSVAEPGEFGAEKDDDSVELAPPLVVAVSTYDAEAADEEKGGESGKEESAAEALPLGPHSARSGSGGAEGGEVAAIRGEVPLEMATPATAQPISQDGMARVALEASIFLFERATTLSDQGWYNKAKGVFSECLDIREQYAQGQPALTQAIVAMGQNLMDMYKHGDAPLIWTGPCCAKLKQVALANHAILPIFSISRR